MDGRRWHLAELALEIVHGTLDLQRQGLHSTLLAGGVPQIIIRQLKAAGEIQGIALAYDHLAIAVTKMNQSHPPIRLIQAGRQISQGQLGNIDSIQLKACIRYQTNQLANQRFAGCNNVHQRATPTGRVFRKCKHIRHGVGRAEIEEVLELPFERIGQLTVLNTLRTLNLKHLILINGQDQNRRHTSPALVVHQLAERVLPLCRNTLNKAQRLPGRSSGSGPGNAIRAHLKTDRLSRRLAADQFL